MLWPGSFVADLIGFAFRCRTVEGWFGMGVVLGADSVNEQRGLFFCFWF